MGHNRLGITQQVREGGGGEREGVRGELTCLCKGGLLALVACVPEGRGEVVGVADSCMGWVSRVMRSAKAKPGVLEAERQ